MRDAIGETRVLDAADRWLRAAVSFRPRRPTFFQSVDVDVSGCKALLTTLRADGVHVTYTHILVHAVALALKALPNLHQVVYGNRRHYPQHVNLGLMVAGDQCAVPMMRIQKVETKNLIELAKEIIDRAPETLNDANKQLALLRRWGWIVPFDFLKRWILRGMDWIGQRIHPEDLPSAIVSCSSQVVQCATFDIGATALVCSGVVQDKVVVVDGQPVIRPMWNVTCVGDHGIWDGRMSETFLLKLKSILETTSFIVADPKNSVVARHSCNRTKSMKH